jgi:hypothetical protein
MHLPFLLIYFIIDSLKFNRSTSVIAISGRRGWTTLPTEGEKKLNSKKIKRWL